MAERSPRKLAVILHADVVGSTALVQRDEALAHERIRDVFHRFSASIESYNGHPLELRGDALVAEFGRASDAVEASLAFQAENTRFNSTLEDDIRPTLRVGISLGEVVVADNTITGEGIVLAQRLEQLASGGGVCIQGAVYEAVPGRLPFDYESLGEQELKGFSEPVRAYAVSLKSGEAMPLPEARALPGEPQPERPKRLRLVAAVTALLVIVGGGLTWLLPWVTREEPASIERMAFPLPDNPSIAVLPFTNMSDDAEQEYFADGMTDDLITDLSKLSGLFVIARNSAFTYKGKNVDVQAVGNELGVKYVLEGSVRRAGDQVRINAQLIDARTGGHLWADRYDGSMTDVFALQDQVTRKIIAGLAVKLTSTEKNARSHKGTFNTEAYDAFLQGWEHYQRFKVDDFIKAIPHFQRAVELDPNYGHAYAALASLYWITFRHGDPWSLKVNPDSNNWVATTLVREKVDRYADLAMRNPSPLAHKVMSAISWDYRQFDEAIVEAERAVTFDPNDPDGHVALAWALIFSGRPQEAVNAIERAMRLDPLRPGAYMYVLGMARVMLRQYIGAVTALELAQERSPEYQEIYLPLVVAYIYSGHDEKARIALKRYSDEWTSFQRSKVDGVMGWVPFKREIDIRHFAGALVKAGLCCEELLEQYVERVRLGGTLQ